MAHAPSAGLALPVTIAFADMNKTKELAWELFKNWTTDCKGLNNLSKEERLSVFENVATWAQEAAITFEHTEI
jgi:hypothetical protein